MVFAQLILEREPLSLADVPASLLNWIQVVGMVSALALLPYWLARTAGTGQKGPLQGGNPGFNTYLSAVCGLTIAFLGITVVAGLFYGVGATFAGVFLPSGQRLPQTIGDYALAVVGGLALIGVLAPFLSGLAALRWGRVWALARVSLKEAIRRKVLYVVFGVMALVFLFADWFLPYKPEDQIRNYVLILYFVMTILFLVVASLLGAFGIPTDVKNQAMHTIVTKPVEKFEIVLGRFVGYGILISASLAVLTGLSLIYLIRDVHPEARRESYRARAPLFGNRLTFMEGNVEKEKGVSVGRPWDYRSYISGPHPQNPNRPRQYAVWKYDKVPGNLGEGAQAVRFEFTFDIFRLTKGEQGKGIYCTLVFASGALTMADLDRQVDKYRKEYDQRNNQEILPTGLNLKQQEQEQFRIKGELAQKHGVYEVAGKEVTDYHTQSLDVPAGLFQGLAAAATNTQSQEGQAPPPEFKIVVSVDRTSPSQMLGVARRDLYLLADDHPFELNFLKGVVGMWCSFMLVLGVAVAASTYLSGVIAWFTTVFLFFAGMFTEFIQKLSEGRLQGGGPVEAFFRLTTGRVVAAPLDESGTTVIVRGADEIYRWWLRRVLHLLPDVNRFDLHRYVANGFDISWSGVLLLDNFVSLVGYLLPWAILAYYLMKFREIANPT